jgi:hypothetical protein
MALVEFGGYLTSDITAFESEFGLPNVQLKNILLNGSDGTPNGGSVEVTVDIEMMVAFAPGSEILVYEDDSNTGWFDMLTRIATDDIAKVVKHILWICGGRASAGVKFRLYGLQPNGSSGTSRVCGRRG